MTSRSVPAAARAPGLSPDRWSARALWLVALAPLAWWPDGFSRFTFPKLLLLALALACAAWGPARGRMPRRLLLLVLVALLVLASAAVASDAPVASLVGRWPRYEGVPTLALYLSAAWVGARVAARDARALVAPLTVVSTTLGVLALLDLVHLDLLALGSGARGGSVLGNATDQGVVAVLCLAVLGDALLRDHTPAPLVGATGALVTVAASGSRTALLVGVLVLVVLALRVRGRRTAVTTGAGLAVLLVATLAFPSTRERLLSGTTVEGRLLQWPPSWRLALDHPLLGVGPSGYLDAFGRYETADWVRWAGPYQQVDSPHSWLLQAWSAGGVPLVLLALVVAAYVVRLGVDSVRARPELFGSLLAVLACGVALLPNFTSAGPVALGALLVGVLVGEPIRTDEPAWRARTVAAVGAAAAVVLAAACISEWSVQRGVEAAGRGDATAAAEQFDNAIRWRPWDADLSMLAAQGLAPLASAGDVEAALVTERYARESLVRTPHTYASQVALGAALLAQQRADEALVELDDAVDTFPRRPAALVQRALTRAALGQLDEASADLERAAALAPRDASIPRLREAIRQESGRSGGTPGG
ncbi:O-antigen ligase family protein [Nocardioides sp.]|uniref:O-antigen ligase family protein n=1 Tax=Nocardioides sp. TaxID=35761 RepID=UPI0035AD8493